MSEPGCFEQQRDAGENRTRLLLISL